MTKIETVKQQDLKDCGACSLLCIIKYYGGYVPLEKIREDTCTTASGTSAYHLINAAKNYGFDSIGVKANDIYDSNIYLPAIAHVILKNGLEHFVVIYKITKTHVFLMDPAEGKVKMSITQFSSIWDNILILLSPINQIVSYSKENNLLEFFLKIFNSNKKIFLKLCLINLLLMFVTIFSNFYFQIAINSIQKGQDNTITKIITIIFSIIFFFKVIFEFLKNYYLMYLNKNIDVTLFCNFLEHIFHLPLNFIQNRTTGEIVSRVEELNSIKEMAALIFSEFLLNSILILGAVVALFMISNELFFGLCLVVIIYLIIGLTFSRLIYKKVKDGVEYSTNFNTTLVEHIDMASSIKNLNLVPEFLYHLENKLIIMLKNNFNLSKLLNWIETSKSFVYEFGIFLITSYGIYLIEEGRLELLSLITFNSLILYLLNPIKELVSLVPKWSYLKATFQKLSDFLGIETNPKIDGLQNLAASNIEAKDLKYSYNKYNNIFENISFKILKGDKVLLSGPSGCGKSTICKILANNILKYSGILEFNGANKLDYNFESLSTSILYVGQNEKLFTGSIKENITCFRNIEDEKFLSISKICKLEEIVNKRPNRYDSLINASLNNLSGGEKQRIVLARSLLKSAHIIILDEALSEVNIEMEREILDNIFNYFKEKTLIYVTHKNVLDKFKKVIQL